MTLGRPLLPTSSDSRDTSEQRLRSGLSEIVRKFLDSNAFLMRLLPGSLLRAVTTGIPVALSWGSLNRVVGDTDIALQLPAIEPRWVGVPLRLSKTYPTGVAYLRTAGKALDRTSDPLINGSATGIQVQSAGLHTLVTDGANWFAQATAVDSADETSISTSVATGGVGEIRLHDLTHNPIGLWQFSDDINDSSGNGFHLSPEVGQPRFAVMTQRLKGLQFSGLRLTHPTATLLAHRSDMTIEMLGMFEDALTANSIFVTYTLGSTDVGADANYLYQISADLPRDPTWFSEHGVGVNDSYRPSMLALPPPGEVFHLAASRISDRVQFYLNGKAFGTLSPTLFTPTDGERSRLFVGGQGGSGTHTAFSNFIMASLKIVPTGLSAAAVRAEYDRTLGPFMGTQF